MSFIGHSWHADEFTNRLIQITSRSRSGPYLIFGFEVLPATRAGQERFIATRMLACESQMHLGTVSLGRAYFTLQNNSQKKGKQHTRKAMATELRGPTAHRLGYVDTRGVRSFSQRIEVAISILGTKISPLEVDLI